MQPEPWDGVGRRESDNGLDFHDLVIRLEERVNTNITIQRVVLGVVGAVLLWAWPIARDNHAVLEKHESRLEAIEKKSVSDHLVCHKKMGTL